MKKKKETTFEKLNTNKLLISIVGIVAVIALVFIGYGILKPQKNLDTTEKNASVSEFPKSIGKAYQVDFNQLNYLYRFFYHKAVNKYSIFCTEFVKESPAANGADCKLSSTQWDEPTQAAIGTIIKNVTGSKNGIMSNMKNYYYGETSINQYFYNKTGKSVNDMRLGKNAAVKSESQTVYDLVQKANTAYNNVKKFSLAVTPATSTLKKSGNYYVTGKYTVSTTGSYTITLSGISGAAVYNKSGNTFQVRVPAANIKSGNSYSLSVKVTSTISYPVAARYDCGDTSYYQPVTPSLVYTRKKSAAKTVKASISTTKVVIDKVNSDGKYVKGATLNLKSKDGKYNKNFTTEGKQIVLEGLAYGVYTLTETKEPDGYKKQDVSKTCTLDAKHLSCSLKIVNYSTGITVSKIASDTNSEIPGAELRIVDSSEKVAYGPWTTTKDKKIITGLKAGTYYLEEVKAPVGYKKSNVRIKFTIASDGTLTTDAGKVEELVFTNEPLKATFSKTDIANSKELPGAQLEILDEGGKTLYKWISSNTPRVISNMPAGKYYLVETQEPKGYVKKKEKLGFEIDVNGNITVGGKQVDKVMMTNEKTKVKISKQDVTNGKEIPGAQLEVKDANGKVVDKWKSTNKPHLIEGLSVGKYYLTEKIAPKGYVVSEEKIEFTIKNDGTVDTVVMLNTPIVDVPNTASTASIIASIIGIIAVIFGGWMIYNNVKTKKAQ